jgi:hypothetical protein
MSEESKSAEGEYVMMGSTGAVPGRGAGVAAGLDDPNLSQEEKDHRLAIAMQQQENAAAYNDHQKKHEDIVSAKNNRTARSGTFTKLAAVRDKDQGMLSVPADYATDNAYVKSTGGYMGSGNYALPGPNASPQEIADFKMEQERHFRCRKLSPRRPTKKRPTLCVTLAPTTTSTRRVASSIKLFEDLSQRTNTDTVVCSAEDTTNLTL